MAKKGGFGKLLLGVGIGAALGALLTPRTGEENRKLLKKKTNEVLEKAKNIDYEALKEKLYDEFYEIKDQLKDMDQEKALEIAKVKLVELEAKADKLIAEAIEANKPKVEKALVELKKKTAATLKDLSKKLEA